MLDLFGIDVTAEKRTNGVYYTTGNPFGNVAFARWANAAGLPKTSILEPFAGANLLITSLKDMGLCRRADSFDIAPAHADVKLRDTLADFPKGYDVCITNPPWLAKNSATRRGLAFPESSYDDLYKFALNKCINHCAYVAALVPESFIRASLFQERMSDFVSLTGDMFIDTDNPVGLALFAPDITPDVQVWRNSKKLGTLSKLESYRPRAKNRDNVRFNDPDGNVGFIAIDNTREASIRFCDPKELGDYEVRGTCRSITKILVDAPIRIEEWNRFIDNFRQQTRDVLLTSFKGLRKDGLYRRRADWDFARGVINYA